jgi:hypothetical protein
MLVAMMAGVGSARAATISVPAGADLQQALNAAQPGDTILLEPGATYIGNFQLPNKSGASFITVMTWPTGSLSSVVRISPAESPQLAKLRSPNGAPALRTAPASHHWRIMLIEFLANVGGAGDIIALGDGQAQATLGAVPHDLVIDRCYIHSAPGAPQKRGIALNSASTTVTGSYISEIKSQSQDSQAIAGWNGPGPYTITNNYLEAAGENVMFGGGDPAIPNLVPGDITIEDNAFAKPTAWRTQPWVVKNLFELKNARRVTVRRNTFEYNWQSGQSGFAILFTVRNQDGGCPWCQVEDVLFEKNVVRHVAAGINVLGFDDNHPSLQTNGITIRNNLFADVDPQQWGGNGYFLQLLGGAADVTIDHNTIVQTHAAGIVVADGPPVSGFIFTNNIARHGEYGFIGTDHAPGNHTISAYFPGAVIRNNVIAEGNPAIYPSGNLFPSYDVFRSQFVDFDAGNYTLIANSPWRGAGTDGRDLGTFAGDGTSDRRIIPTDADGNGMADLMIFRPQAGQWFTRLNGGGITVEQFGLAGDVPVPGDYDGDGVMERAVYRPSTATWFLRNGAVVQWEPDDLPVPGDYDGDDVSDVAVYRPSTGVWHVRYSSLGSSAAARTIALGVATDIPVPADYDGDGKTDAAVYRPHTGMWFVRNSSSTTAVARQWGLSGDVPVPGDYDGDGQSDFAVYRPFWGFWYIVLSSTGAPLSDPVQWGLNGDVPVQSDYDGDGRTDLAVYRPSEGIWYIAYSTTNFATSVSYQWGLSGDVPAANASIAHAMATAGLRAPTSTLVNGARAGDFDNDGRGDLNLYRPTTGEWFTAGSRVNFNICDSGAPGPCAPPVPYATLGVAGDIPVPSDYDGDGTSDAAVYSPSSGMWTIAPSTNTSVLSTRQWGLAGDVPLGGGDFDGDGRSDIGVYRPSTGEWYILQSSTANTQFMQFQWGLPGDVPVPQDYDGDGLTDLAVYRPSNGVWYIRHSRHHFSTFAARRWGLPADTPVPGDYDGDGATDVAVFRPQTGEWYVYASATGTAVIRRWGVDGDAPVSSDYDGDGKTDFAVWRPSTTMWYVLKSSSSGTASIAIQWGSSGDTPVPAP